MADKRRNLIRNIVTLAAIYAIIQLLISFDIIDQHLQLNLFLLCINIILAVSLNLITGFTGQFSLGHAGFMAIGAYVSAVMTLKLHLPFPLAIAASAVSAAIVGVLVGIPTLRLRGDYLAIATLGLSEIIRIIALNIDYIGGASGLADIPRYVNWPWIFAMTAGTIIIIYNFIHSSYGRACIAIREDDIAAESMGIDIAHYKILAFTIGAFFAGIAGSLYANYFYFLKPNAFGFMKSIDILVMVVFGGLGSITGSVVGAAALTLLSMVLQDLPTLRMILYALLLLVIMLYRPQGLLGNAELSWKLLKRGDKDAAATNSK
ncbi:MAG: branched-chain amino acid transport system permease protein [Clostridiales bacterium]|jgi:branched-chain amino acid transport system permease protein|nr:branched-chain amino acid transport system permease protein [Clostridiales bacterium]MDK2992220.1 branched-chain amino acid transport system permease protein [Clostridiales bacterium]